MLEEAPAFQSPVPEIHYPESDGKPMAESDEHRDELCDLIFTLKDYFTGHDDIYVSGNLLLYYEEGNPEKRVSPDVFVVQGVPVRQRRTYRLWEEGKAPVMVIELTSKETETEDQQEKPEIYAAMGIEYYFLYDVLGDYLTPVLQGKRLGSDGKYHSLTDRLLPCPPLGLDLTLDHASRLQLVDRVAGEVVIRHRLAADQAMAELKQAEERRRTEEALQKQTEALQKAVVARKAAEEKVARLEALLGRQPR